MSCGNSGYARLPGNIMIQWKQIPKRTTDGDYAPTRWFFTKQFKSTPFFAFATMEKNKATNEGSFWGWIYTGSWHGSEGNFTNGIFKDYVVFSRWNRFTYRAIAIGPV